MIEVRIIFYKEVKPMEFENYKAMGTKSEKMRCLREKGDDGRGLS